jgi:hypothetical protein
MNKNAYQLRLKLEEWEKNKGISQFSEKAKIIYSFLVANKNNLPISIKLIKKDKLIQSSMSIASFNRSINELLEKSFINLDSDPIDRRSLRIIKIK